MRSRLWSALLRLALFAGGGLVLLGLLGFLFPYLSDLFSMSFQSDLRAELERTAQLARWAGMRTGVSGAVLGATVGAPAEQELEWQIAEAQSFRESPGGSLLGTGRAVCRIVIPALGLDAVVLDGVEPEQLAKGPGHYPTTPGPGADGNCCIAGHRVTFGHPFRHVDQLHAGDEIRLEAGGASYRYTVTSTFTVPKTDNSPLEETDAPTLTLTTCHPPHSATSRLVIRAARSG
jgi:LPXTG-site transpeptidase (sortase) family protein